MAIPSPVKASPWSDVARLLWFSSALLLLAALLTYSPDDPSWSTWSNQTLFKNCLGRVGSFTADLLFQGLGLVTFLLPAAMGAMGFRRLAARAGEKSWKSTLGFASLLLLSLCGLFELAISKSHLPLSLVHAGGIVGLGIKEGLSFALGEGGALFIAVVSTLCAVILLFRLPLLTWLTEGLANLARRAIAIVQALRMRCQETQAPIATPVPAPTPPILRAIPITTPESPRNATPSSKEAEVPIGKSVSEDEQELLKLMAPAGGVAAKGKGDVELTPPTKRQHGKPFVLPGPELLSGRAESATKAIDRAWYIEKGNILVQKLKDFGVDGEVVHISPGPVITVYEFKPASGVKIKEIANLSDDLTLALSVLSVRIVAPIPGKPVVGIEIPSPHRETVFFKDLLQETPFYSSDIRIPIVLGRLASGEPVVAGLASMPHLLVAGSTGTGKSVFINNLICSLLYRYTPDQLKLILVDPKMVELSSYEGIPHLMLPVVVDSKKAALALRWTVDEMERRYSLMHRQGVRHVDAYNERIQQHALEVPEEDRFLPYIVVVIDEYADLMAVVPKDVELSIARLAQKARASGIHLVLATQRPSTDVVTGTIKANFPSRISFRVASSVDSKTILDRTGAERLLGNGDMLFHSAGFTSLKRLQGAFFTDADLERVVGFLKDQGEPRYDERILRYQEEALANEEPMDSDGESEEGDLYDRAVRLVAEKGEASISLIQRHLKIGYNRAASLMEQMEKEGIVAQATGVSKRRQVLVNSV